jgi:hypothetical protein
MGLDINGALFQSSSNAISITANSIKGLDIDSGDRPILANRPSFYVDTNSAAITIAAGWTTLVFTNAFYNNGSHYNVSNGRFTAPVTGTYWFFANLYVVKTTGNADAYSHPIFLINGSYTARQASANNPYRLRLRNNATGGYSRDNDINDVFYLTAGDYVNFHVYMSAQQTYYGYHSGFGGFLIG